MFTTANQPPSEVNWVIKWRSEEEVIVRSGQILGAFAGAILFVFVILALGRSEERRVGKECRSRWSPYH